MVKNTEWVKKTACVGALLGGVAGFFCGIYVMAASHALSWTDVPDAMASIVVLLITAFMIASLCIAVGWVAGLVLGAVASPRRSPAEKHQAPSLLRR